MDLLVAGLLPLMRTYLHFLQPPLHKTPFPFQSLLETLTVVLYPLKMG